MFLKSYVFIIFIKLFCSIRNNKCFERYKIIKFHSIKLAPEISKYILSVLCRYTDCYYDYGYFSKIWIMFKNHFSIFRYPEVANISSYYWSVFHIAKFCNT